MPEPCPPLSWHWHYACNEAAKASSSAFEIPVPRSCDGYARLKGRLASLSASSLAWVLFHVKPAVSRYRDASIETIGQDTPDLMRHKYGHRRWRRQSYFCTWHCKRPQALPEGTVTAQLDYMRQSLQVPHQPAGERSQVCRLPLQPCVQLHLPGSCSERACV